MKITFTPDDPSSRCGVHVEIRGDELTLPKLIDELLIPALLAWGFHADTVGKYFAESEDV